MMQNSLTRTAEAIENAKRWLLESGIQNSVSISQINGGFNSWYDIKTKRYPYIYSEITGYGTTALLYLDHLKEDKVLVRKAELAAEWLIKRATVREGYVKSIYYIGDFNDINVCSFKDQTIHSFDNGIILNALVNLYTKTNNKQYLRHATKIADFLLGTMQKLDGSFYAIYDMTKDAQIESPKKWSTQAGPYHAKIAIGLLNLYDVVKDDLYRKAAIRICENSLKYQQKDGRFVTFQTEDKTHAHPHCYAAEGLLYAGSYLGDDKYTESATKAVKWLLDNQLKNGGIATLYENGRFVPYERCDVLAQTLRLGVLALSSGRLKADYEDKLSQLLNRLLGFQHHNRDIAVDGGFLFGTDIDGKKLRHANSWCTMFTIQALNMFYQYKEKREKINMDFFI